MPTATEVKTSTLGLLVLLRAPVSADGFFKMQGSLVALRDDVDAPGRRRSYGLYAGRLDDERNPRPAFTTGRHAALLEGLVVSAQGAPVFGEPSIRMDRRMYAWTVEYTNVRGADLETVERMRATLLRIDTGLKRLESELGSPADFAEYFRRVAQVIGVDEVQVGSGADGRWFEGRDKALVGRNLAADALRWVEGKWAAGELRAVANTYDVLAKNW